MYFPMGDIPPIRIMSIDPGTAKLGLSILELHPATAKVKVIYATTIESSKHVDTYHIFTQTYGVRAAKIAWMSSQIYYLLSTFYPSMVIAEAPYMGRFATSFEALVEVRDGIKLAIQSWNPGLYFETIEPLNVKMSVGINLTRENRKDKDAVRKALAILPNLEWGYGLCLANCDEHTVDAIAVGYWKSMQLVNLYRFS